MKSAFGSKRKARKIQVDDDEDDAPKTEQGSETVNTVTTSSINSKFGAKPFKKSSLRQSIAFDNQEDDGGPPGNRPTIGRSSSTIKKKKAASSRLSFGPGEIILGDAAEALEDDEDFTPKKSGMGWRIVENTTLRNSLPYQGLPSRDTEEEERPKYSKDYLNELKSSTPTAPTDLHAYIMADDEEGLDASELEGAMIVDIPNTFKPSIPAFIPSEAEIREKKDRRARLAQEKEFISFDSTDDDHDRRQISHPSLLKDDEEDTRLVREDEDLGEGFDEFVEDGRIALGKKQEREAKRKQRKEMAAMIKRAEGSSDDDSDDSEAERRAAYEAAQTRAGMDGLKKVKDPREDSNGRSIQIPAKITPLPALGECLERLKTTMGEMERELARRRKGIEEAKQEKIEILAREVEVQEMLKQAGERFAALKADSTIAGLGGIGTPIVVDRGLESFGNTPVGNMDVEDIG